jgi:hypothetical protein
MKKKKKLSHLTVVTMVALPLALGIWFFSSASSFNVDEIYPGRDFSFQKVKTDSTEDIENTCFIVNQNFRLFKEDIDAYLFLSEDGKYVLKFFKMRKFTPKYWLNYIPIPWLDKKRLSKVVDRERARHESLGKLKAVFEKFRSQTGLVFLHLFKTDYLKTKVTLIDQNGKKKRVSLDDVPFILRRRAIPIKEFIENSIAKGEQRSAIASLCSILDFVKRGCKLGFSGYSDQIERDYGFLDGRLIYLGLSHLSRDASYKAARSTLREVFRISCALDTWLQSHYPLLAQGVQDEMQDLLSFLEEE